MYRAKVKGKIVNNAPEITFSQQLTTAQTFAYPSRDPAESAMMPADA
jgi:hypothetical protein